MHRIQRDGLKGKNLFPDHWGMLVQKTLQHSYPQVDTTQFYVRSGEEFQQPSTLPYCLGHLVCGWFKSVTQRLAGSSATKPGLVLCLPGGIFESPAWKARTVSGSSKSPGWLKTHQIETVKCIGETLYNFKVALQAFLCTWSDSKTKDFGEKKENQSYMNSIVLPINCGTSLGNQSFFGQQWNTCCMDS